MRRIVCYGIFCQVIIVLHMLSTISCGKFPHFNGGNHNTHLLLNQEQNIAFKKYDEFDSIESVIFIGIFPIKDFAKIKYCYIASLLTLV